MWFLFSFIFFVCSNLVAHDSWVEVEYLGWFTKETSLPIPLITSASLADPLPGAIGQPNTRVLLGKEALSSEWQNGFRINVGSWLFPECGTGFEASYFLLPKVKQHRSLFTSGEIGSPNLAVPIDDVAGVLGLGGVAGQTLFILPGPVDGLPGFEGLFSLDVSHQLQGAEIDYTYIVGSNGCFQLDGFLGIQWVQLKESLLFEGTTHTAAGAPFASNFFNFKDRFGTDNNFVGGTIGFKTFFQQWDWLIETGVKVGIGVTNERVSIHGTSQTAHGNLFFTTLDTASEILPGGIFAQPTNNGTFDHRIFASTLEAQIRLAYQVASFLEFNVGYRFFFLNRVTRPGNQMDRNVNSTLTALADASRATEGTGPGPIPFGVPGAAPAAAGNGNPQFSFKQSNYWAQGFTAGFALQF